MNSLGHMVWERVSRAKVFGDVHGFCGIGGYGVPFKSEELPIGFCNQTDVSAWRMKRS
jgi:hypothetical protein